MKEHDVIYTDTVIWFCTKIRTQILHISSESGHLLITSTCLSDLILQSILITGYFSDLLYDLPLYAQ